MAVEKRLAFSIVQFLRDQTHCGALNSDEQESLEGRSAALFTLRFGKLLYKYRTLRSSPVCFRMKLTYIWSELTVAVQRE